MQTATAEPGTNVTTINKGKGTGRKDKSGQPAVKSTKVVAEAIDNLVDLTIKAKLATDAAAEAIAAVAEKSGLLASVVRKFVNARSGDRYEDKKRENSQLGLLFDDVGQSSATPE